MPQAPKSFGLFAALVTPWTSAGAADTQRMVALAQRLLGEGCNGVTLFGTTGEGPSIGQVSRQAILSAFAKSGLSMRERVAVAVATSSCEDAGSQVGQALKLNARAVLLAPPYYFRTSDEAGIEAWFNACFKAAGPGLRDVILYHIPSMTGISLSPGLIERLRKGPYGRAITGVKDSGSNLEATKALLKSHGDLAILVGDERHLAEAVRLGGQGAISGLANLIPGDLKHLIASKSDNPNVNALVEAVVKHPVIPAIKTLVAARSGEAAFGILAPPLSPLSAQSVAVLVTAFRRLFPDA